MRDATVSRLGWGAILLGLASILILGISAYGYRTDWWPVVRALDVATWSAWAAVAGTFTALVAIALWLRRKRGGGGMALLGLVLSLPILTVAAARDPRSGRVPRANRLDEKSLLPGRRQRGKVVAFLY